MLEIILLIVLCWAIGNMLRAKGRKPLAFQLLLVLLWFGGLLAGGVVAGVVHLVRHGDAPFELTMATYLYAVGGGVSGAAFCFLLAHLLPPQDAEKSGDGTDRRDFESDFRPVPPVDPSNPYAATSFVPVEVPRKHSRLGIASAVIGVLTLIGAIAMVTIAGVIELNNPGGADEESVEVLLIGLSFFAITGLSSLGLVLGWTAVTTSSRRLSSILGLAINGLVLFGLLALIVVGFSLSL